MIAYENDAYLAVLLRASGSVVPDCLPVSIACFLFGLTLTLLREHTDLMNNAGEYIEHPLGVRIIATVLGLLLAMRTSMALNRWMDGISQVQLMLSKWGDAYMSLSGFFADRVTHDTDEETQLRILLFRVRIAHWFSLMSCLAFATLRARQIISLSGVPIQEMFAGPDDEEVVKTFAGDAIANTGSQSSHTEPEMPVIRAPGGDLPELDLMVLSAPSRLETQLLEIATDKVNTIYLWITQGIIEEVRAKTLDTAPPIVSRVFQELSNGKLGFAQAHRVAMVPFPFPFAQMISVLMVITLAVMPLYIELFTQNPIMSPLLCFVCPLCYMGLNRVAVELEEPFGTDWNDVDIEIRHHEFLLQLADIIRMDTLPPNYSKGLGRTSRATEERILRGCSQDVPRNVLSKHIRKYLSKAEEQSSWVCGRDSRASDESTITMSRNESAPTGSTIEPTPEREGTSGTAASKVEAIPDSQRG